MFWKRHEEKSADKLAIDPICGMEVDPAHAYSTEIGGQTYYFCGAGCKAAFKKSKNKALHRRPVKIRRSPRGGGGSCH
ncbi:MAG: YHS domain-containing protein [Nitrososphaerales archaeon]